jgi:hypothetical protein
MSGVRALTGQGREVDALAAAEALCNLAVQDAPDLYLQAQALSACVRQLDDSRLAAASQAQAGARREALRGRCADRAIAALTLALQRGLEDVSSSALQDILSPLRTHPGYEKLADQLREPGRTGLEARQGSQSDAP